MKRNLSTYLGWIGDFSNLQLGRRELNILLIMKEYFNFIPAKYNVRTY